MTPEVSSVLLAHGLLQTRDNDRLEGVSHLSHLSSPTCPSPPAPSPTSLIRGLTSYFQPDLGPAPPPGAHVDPHTPASAPISEWHCPHQWLRLNPES